MSSAEITKNAIAGAMKELMEQKPLAKISVGDIVGACGINRNSFYYHFKDKYDLVNWIFYTEITENLTEGDALEGDSWHLIRDICQFFYKNRAFYANALSVSGQNSFAEYFGDLLKTFALARTADMFEDDENRDFFATFFADAFVVTLHRWLTTDSDTPPEKLASLMQKAVQAVALTVKDPREKEDKPPL